MPTSSRTKTYVEHVHCNRCGKRCSGVDPELGLVVRAWVECPECLEQVADGRESFAEWLARQVAAAKAQYESTTTKGRKRRHWDAFMLMTGVQAEYARRTR